MANPYIRSSGFILFYSLWILTVIGLTLTVVIKQQKSIAKVGTAQLDYVLQKRQMLNVLDYVLTNTYEQTVSNDSRIDAYEKFVESTTVQKAIDLKGLDQILPPELLQDVLNSIKKPPATQTTKEGLKAIGSSVTTTTTKNTGIYSPTKIAYTLKIKDRTYTISIWPSNAYPNLNTLNKLALQRYLQYLGLSKHDALQLAGVIKDWTDQDDFTEDDGGAEWGVYTQKEQPYKPRNSPIKNWQELNFLLDANPGLVMLLRQNFILEGSGGVDRDYVNDAQIAALAGVEQAVVEKWRLQHNKETEASGKIDSKEQHKIDSVVASQVDIEQLVIKISAGKTQLTAWFDWKNKQLHDWSFSPVPPVKKAAG